MFLYYFLIYHVENGFILQPFGLCCVCVCEHKTYERIIFINIFSEYRATTN